MAAEKIGWKSHQVYPPEIIQTSSFGTTLGQFLGCKFLELGHVFANWIN